jgi:hypothetical protein
MTRSEAKIEIMTLYGIPSKLAGLFKMTLKMQGSANKFWNCCGTEAWWRIMHTLVQSVYGEDYRECGNKFKGKAIPLQAWTGHEGSRRLRLPDFKTIGTWRWQGCQPYAPAAFTPRKGHSAAGRIMSMKNSNDTIGNRNRDLPACSAVAQPTAPARKTNSRE